MRVVRLTIDRLRGIKRAVLLLPEHGVIIGDNNVGKTTILEALDLALGPDRLNRQAPIDEHDFFRGEYLSSREDVGIASDQGDGGFAPNPSEAGEEGATAMPGEEPEPVLEGPRIEVEATVADLTDEQKARFGNYVEFWDEATDTFYDQADPAGVDLANITEAIRVTFHGRYEEEEDDFEGRTYFTRTLTENDRPVQFTRKDKQVCGFLYLRSLRTGSRALSLERGSLLDIILRLKEVRPQMWEDTLRVLSGLSVASNPELGISPVLDSINSALARYVPAEWGIQPHLKVSSLTREHLRKVITAFIATGAEDHAAPYYRQGTGTINMLVLAMLSLIAEDKQNVIFAMEEPETAIPPYAQKRIVHEVRRLASQTIFTSHSPYVLEEFALEETIVVSRDAEGELRRQNITLPDSVKPKRYRQEFRTRFCEGLLARRILVAEGATEASAFPVACRRLAELNPNTYSSLEALGVCTIDAGGESNLPSMAQLYRELGKRTYALCDRQDDNNRALIEAQSDLLLMHDEDTFESLVLDGTTEDALKRFARSINWPSHLQTRYPDPEADAPAALAEYFHWSKGTCGVAEFLAQCREEEMPGWIRAACINLQEACNPPPPAPDAQFSRATADGQGLGADVTE